MRECTIILPDNRSGDALPPIAFRSFEREVCQAFGGFTVTLGHGAWRDANGIIIKDTVRVYTIATDDVTFQARDTDDTLRSLARDYGRRLSQDAVYVRLYTGEVEILACEKAPKLIAAE